MAEPKPKILIVDDEPKNHRVLERILEPLNLDIEKALSGQKALEVAHCHDFFLILMDVQMPIMDGFETASLILDHPKTQHIPVIFVTAYAKDDVFEFQGYESGAVDYLTKPINDCIMKSKVSVFLQLWQQRQMLNTKNEELQQLNNKSEQLNHELLQIATDLEKAKNIAETATKTKSEFLSNMSHELRSPLNSILVLSRLLSEKKYNTVTERDIKSAGIIYASGSELLRLINDLLDLAKVEAGMIVILVEAFSLQDMLETLVTQMSPLAEEKALPLVLNIEANVLDLVQTDPLRLGQILRNLVSNAIKFTCGGQVTISVKSLNDTHLSISVSDTGIGIKPENLDSIFEVFKQEDSTVTRRFGGTGLGLSISLNMTRLLGGNLHISSELDKGSCFTLEIPFNLPLGERLDTPNNDEKQALRGVINNDVPARTKDNISSPEPTVQLPNTKSIANGGKLKNKTVLLVEDQARNVFTMMAALNAYGVDIQVAENGQVALDKLEQCPQPDVVLMDLMMPVMDGYEAIKKIRENTQWHSLPVIVVTANGTSSDKTLCLELGATDYLNKPIDIDKLVSTMTQVIASQARCH
jgi:signal transduction histidine kinase